MNGNGVRRAPSGNDSRYSFESDSQSTSKVPLNGYNGSLGRINSNGGSPSQHDQVSQLRVIGDLCLNLLYTQKIGSYVRSSDLLDPNDPVSMHLLMETALGDSQQYRVLSFEEVDDLKKRLDVLFSQIDGLRRKLAIESKIRDASASLNRLPSSSSRESVHDGITKSAKRHRLSIMSRTSGSGIDPLNKSNDELAHSTRICEDLTQELWSLEKQSQDLQKQLLEHTAGVLQMTHEGSLAKPMPLRQENSILDRADGDHKLSLVDGLGDFNDSSFYQTLDSLLKTSDSSGDNQSNAAFEQQTQSIFETERKIWDLNRRLRDSISQASSGRQVLPVPPAPNTADLHGIDAALQTQLEYLEGGLDRMQRSHIDTLQNYKKSAYAAEERLEDLNSQLRGIIIRSSNDPNPQYPLPPEVSGKSPEDQIGFLEGGLDTLEQRVQHLRESHQESSSRALAHEQKAGHYDSIIQSLWHDFLAGEEAQREQDSMDEDKSAAPKDNFSLESFATKVHTLRTRLADLGDQKDVLGRQVQQQRELNSSSMIEKDARLTELSTSLDQVRRDLELSKDEHASEGNALKAQLSARDEARSQILVELQDKHNAIAALESQLQNFMVDQENQVAKAKDLETVIEEKSAEADKARNEMKRFEGEMVRLQTELTVAKAELDGAYGTRAQRAAEVASHPALLQEINDLKERNMALETGSNGNEQLNQRAQWLQKELSETIAEYEVMTKSSIEFEKEREQLENAIDNLRDRCESLEAQLSDEKVKWLGVKSPGPPGSRESMGPNITSTSVLKNEFKKLMKDTRVENMKALRVGGFFTCPAQHTLIVSAV